MSTIEDTSVAVSTAQAPSLNERVRRLWYYRNLWLNMVRRDLRIRYKESFLGFLWSLLNPLMYLVIFYIVFVKITPAGIPNFVVFFLSGLLPWTLYQNTMMAATNSVVGGAPLLKRVSFPREVLPLATIGSGVFQFSLQMVVLLGALAIFRYNFFSPYLLLVIPALVVEILLLCGLSLIVSALTVYLRDLTHFMELALLFWFWVTPVVYPVYLVYKRVVLVHHLSFSWVMLNPMVAPVMAFQRAFYDRISPKGTNILVNFPFSWYVRQLAILTVVSFVLIWVGFIIFGRLEGNFAEEM